VRSCPPADYPDNFLYEKSADAAKISDNMFAMIQSLVHTDF
jgi:hypothetical protein